MSQKLNSKDKINDSVIFKKIADAGIKAVWTTLTDPKIRHRFVTEDGKRIVLSYSHDGRPKELMSWRFNFQKLPEHKFDFAVCSIVSEIENGKYSSIFVFPSDLIGGRIITMTEHSLRNGRDVHFIENWNLIKG